MDQEEKIKKEENPTSNNYEPSIFASDTLDNALNNKDLKITYQVPECLGAKFISEKTTGMALPDQQNTPTDVGLNVGLGIKRKMDVSKKMSSTESDAKRFKKPKTLSEKRERLEEEIMKYGLAAIEKMYPRQNRKAVVPIKKGSRPSPIKMKPKPSGYGFQEIDARKILYPYSHSKYIHEPLSENVVYINRRKGIVPLSSLCKDSKTIMSSNVKLLTGRNVTLGKPKLFVKDQGRMIAIGGSRNKNTSFIQILKVPTLHNKTISQSSLDFVPFQMDSEFVNYAIEALHLPKKKPKVDIRTIKKLEKNKKLQQNTDLQTVLKQKSIIDHVFDKMQMAAEEETELLHDSAKENLEEEEKETLKIKVEVMEEDANNENNNPNVQRETMIPIKEESQNSEHHHQKTFNKWTEDSKSFINPLPDPEGQPVTTEQFKVDLKTRNSKLLAGYEFCDLEECFCKDEGDSITFTEIATPATDGTQSPVGSATKRSQKKVQDVMKNLKKVKRALKTLGVNLIEFDDGENLRKDCEKEHCRLGCVCESIMSKAILPTHCGKLDCMIRCFCSEDSLKKFSSARKVGISPAGFANLQENSQRNLAAEERKFHNTVVTTGGRDLIMISGRQKRERKVPTRYQDSNTLLLDATGKDYINKVQNEGGNDQILGQENNPATMKMVADVIRENVVRKCTVLVPKVDLPLDRLKSWCMFHCQYSCPCSRFKNPLDFGPDRNKPRNLAKRRRQSSGSSEKCNSNNDDVITTNKDFKIRKGQSARTEGFSICPSPRVKLPHRFVHKSNKCDKEDTIEDLSKTHTDFGVITEVTGGDNIISVHLPDLSSAELDLSIKPKDTIQYVDWKALKYMYNHNKIKVWFFSRSSKPLFFISKYSSCPYVTNALDVKDFVRHASNRSELPDLVLSLISSQNEGSKFGILTSNGLAWEISGILQKKSNPSLYDKASLSKVSKMTEPCLISLDQSTQKLPVGQNMVTISKSLKATMQIKLPQTSENQHWCMLKVVGTSGSIQCPDSTLALKSAVLKQAADLSMKEKTTVRIPIPVPGEVASFGVYAVPGLHTHVFVGPFSGKKAEKSDAEVICLDDENEDDKNGEEKKEDDEEVRQEKEDCDNSDDITIIPANNPAESVSNPGSCSLTNNRRKQRLHTKLDEIDKINNAQMVRNLVDFIADKAVTYGERKRKRLLYSKRPLMGQVPTMVTKHNVIDEIDIELEDSLSKRKKQNQSEMLKSFVDPRFEIPPYNNPPSSEYGKIVMAQYGEDIDKNIYREIEISTSRGPLAASISCSSGKVRFPHPKFPNHIVISSSVEDARKWMEEFEKPSVPSLTLNKKPPGLKKLTTFDNDGQTGLALVIKNDTKNEQIQLFYKLGRVVFENYVGRSLSRIQILQGAKSKIEGLKSVVREQESTKKELMSKRSKLFDEFTMKLKGLPTDVKKKFVLELKEGLKKVKEKPKKDSIVIPDLIPIAEDRQVTATPYSDKTGLRTTQKSGKVRRPMNAFMLWAKKHRSTMISSGHSCSEVSKMLASQWQNLSDDEKKQYYIEAEHLKNLHLLQHPDYKFSPKSRKKRKSDEPEEGSNQPPIIEINLE